MAIVKLPLIDKDGTGTFRKADTGEVIFPDSIQIESFPMMMLSREGDTYILINHTGRELRASAVFREKKYSPEFCKKIFGAEISNLYKGFYCQVNKSQFNGCNCHIRGQ